MLNQNINYTEAQCPLTTRSHDCSVPSSTPATPTAIRAAAVTSMMAVLAVMPMSILVLRSILQLTASNSTSDHSENTVTSHLFSCISARKTTSYGTHDTALTLGSIWVVGCVGILLMLWGVIRVLTVLWLPAILLTLLRILFCGRTIAATSWVLRWW